MDLDSHKLIIILKKACWFNNLNIIKKIIEINPK